MQLETMAPMPRGMKEPVGCLIQFPLDNNNYFGCFALSSKVNATLHEDKITSPVTLEITHRMPENAVGEDCSFEIILDKTHVVDCQITLEVMQECSFLDDWNRMKANDPALFYPTKHIEGFSILTLKIKGIVDECTKPFNRVAGEMLGKREKGAEFLRGLQSAECVVRLITNKPALVRIFRRVKDKVENIYPSGFGLSAMRAAAGIPSATSAATRSRASKKRALTKSESSVRGFDSELPAEVAPKLAKLNTGRPSVPTELAPKPQLKPVNRALEKLQAIAEQHANNLRDAQAEIRDILEGTSSALSNTSKKLVDFAPNNAATTRAGVDTLDDTMASAIELLQEARGSLRGTNGMKVLVDFAIASLEQVREAEEDNA